MPGFEIKSTDDIITFEPIPGIEASTLSSRSCRKFLQDFDPDMPVMIGFNGSITTVGGIVLRNGIIHIVDLLTFLRMTVEDEPKEL